MLMCSWPVDADFLVKKLSGGLLNTNLICQYCYCFKF